MQWWYVILLELWNDPWRRSLLHLLFVAVTYGKVCLWLWESWTACQIFPICLQWAWRCSQIVPCRGSGPSPNTWSLGPTHVHSTSSTSVSYTHAFAQPFNGLWSGTAWLGRYEKKHSPTHTHPDRQTSFINFLHLLWSVASSLFSLRAWQSFPQPLSRSSLVFLLVLDPQLHTLCISSPNHHLLFTAHAHTNAACFAVVPMLCHLYLVSLSLSSLLVNLSFSSMPPIHLTILVQSCLLKYHLIFFLYRPDRHVDTCPLTGQTSVSWSVFIGFTVVIDTDTTPHLQQQAASSTFA